ncbi:AAA family ATPase [Terribacillus sp. AE2B 122]|uniref:AAA family ATPase n=1 Tax=Terribacillus sp. AE2B 122 TaxID=1331902 RepID=UPI00144096FE|nr:AAA family ATPase [Terribacillus sp. AE2B 122]VVM33796.1 putative ATP-binding protein [Terribacillus sp. AE2B 122]
MKIKELELENFHGFEHRHIEFNEDFTVLVGDNGTGKTAILDGLTIALGAYYSGFKGVKSRYFRKDEIHTKHYMFNKRLDIQEQYPVKVKAKGSIEGQNVLWSREINDKGGTTTSKNAKSIMNFSNQYQTDVRLGVDTILPIISYYSTQRLWVQRNDRKSVGPARLRYDRLEGYENTLEPVSDIKKIFKWIEEMRYIELQEQEPIDILSAVNSAIAGCVDDCKFVRYDVKHRKLMVFKNNETEPIPFELLSDGYRSVIGLVADLASRMAILNPFLGESVCKSTPGVVLIDEIDLHLHPKWQRKIVNDLKKAFPKVQFIVTTHSPFIVQSLEPGELRKLNKIDNDEFVSSEEFVSKSIEDISEKVMDLKGVQRSDKLNEMYKAAQRYYTLLNQGVVETDPELKSIKEELDDIEALYSSDVAYYAFLKMERKSAGMD